MARDKRIKTTSKQFTTREIFLIILLVFAALIYVYANFILMPMLDEIAVLSTETDSLNAEYASRLAVISQKSDLEVKLEENKEITNNYKSKYFSTTNQEHFIKVLELQLIEEDLEVLSLTFNEAQNNAEFITEEGQASILSSSIISFPFSGTYEKLMELIRRVEQYDQLIRINSLDITYDDMPEKAFSTSSQWFQSGYHEKPMYQGNITLEFFTIDQEYESPYYSTLPDYERAYEFNDSLFLFDDGGLGVPPFFVEKEDESTGGGSIVSGGSDNTNTNSGSGSSSNTGNTGNGSTNGSSNNGSNNSGTGSNTNTGNDPEEDADPATYTVKPGDTLFSISMQFYQSGDPVEDIMKLNNITDPNTLQSGMVLKLPYYGK
ncbi:LysM peptidoglycan-binding domain-containing protein [Proteiniclasticum sp.]|uniref:LysM peptidoglycan-binding domain-containing protein n=1 Tax=Proteiniclasticum sp. TaxID=2053595 RepID=UPI00289A1A0C|nr:LysM peptidoglycan-binding domain-containing protein [Proteiniclasticum sp.]